MAESGLARLCGVSRQAVSLVLRDMVASKTDKNKPDPLQREDLCLQAKGVPAIADQKSSIIFLP
jgi:hypothetical protein